MLEWIARNLLPFLLLIALIRWLLPQKFGRMGVVEVVIINAIGDLAAQAAVGEHRPIFSGLGSIAVWIVASAGIRFMASRWGLLRKLIYGKPERTTPDDVTEATPAELRQLAQSLTAMADRLQQRSQPGGGR